MSYRTVMVSVSVCLALLSGCAGSRPMPHRIATPAIAVPPQFGDSQPVDWTGPAPRHYAVHGIDVSRWQGKIDWRAAAAGGVSFTFIKATEGADLADPGFAANWRGAARAGIPRGAYHFFSHCRSGAEQARWFIRNVPRSPGALPPVLDIEWTPRSRTCRVRPAGRRVRSEAAQFLAILTRHYGQRPIVYTSPDIFHDAQLWRLPQAELWLRSVAGHPSEIYPGHAWKFWQYTGTGHVPGVGGLVDINVFSGSPESWAAWRARRSQ